MKSITINYDVVLIILSSLIILIAARDIIVRKNEKWYKRISFAGWFLIIIATASGCITWQKIKSDKAESDKKEQEAKRLREVDKKELQKDVEDAFKKHDASFNPITKTITILDTSKKIVEPEMDIYRDSTGLFGTFWSHMKFRVCYYCTNTATAYTRDVTLMSFTWDKNGMIDLSDEEPTQIYNGSRSSNGKVIAIEVPYTIPVPRLDQPLMHFYYFKAHYADKLVGGKIINPPLRGLFYIERYTYNPKKWSDIKFGFVDDQAQFKRAMDTLKKRNVW